MGDDDILKACGMWEEDPVELGVVLQTDILSTKKVFAELMNAGKKD